MSYTLHYAPDNASLIIRLALEHRGLPYRTHLVDRAAAEQSLPAYRKLNPNGQIPVLVTPQGPIFETGAILLWLADTHGGLGPAAQDPTRGDFLKWLFWLSNTLHPALRMLFYPDKYIAADAAPALHTGLIKHLTTCYATLNAVAADQPGWINANAPTVLDFYTCALMRWPALYPTHTAHNWFTTLPLPALRDICTRIEALPCTAALQKAEGLGTEPFSTPRPPNPPIGSAT
ncbi:MAG: glutathione S-transferase family protein [Roseobacter sp.]